MKYERYRPINTTEDVLVDILATLEEVLELLKPVEPVVASVVVEDAQIAEEMKVAQGRTPRKKNGKK